MKHITFKSAAITLAAIAFAACDQVKDDERFIEMPAVEAQRVVLLEEFTGQKCVNCPDAHRVIESLEEKYGDNLIVVSIHGGGDAFSYSEDKVSFGLRNEQGQAYCDAYGIAALPAGVVNRTSGVQTHDKWETAIRSELARPSNVELEVASDLNADGTAADITVTVTPHANISGRLQVWAIESGIVARQLSTSGSIPDYVHNNVFRAAVNGSDGESLALTIREPQTLTYTLDIKDKWTPANMQIVAFVYTPADGILQAAKTPLSSIEN
ncbi:MAG: Omp28 family outer membrane lipoprotein [Muribaculaceae bacterium]|nr:Omp28 family outer membrane lipoprotein [Muribaculaceae bacterium]